MRVRKLAIRPEDPGRLRELVTALSKHTQTDAVRVELVMKPDGGMVVIATHSSGEGAEERMAKAVCLWIQGLLVASEPPPPSDAPPRSPPP